MSVLRALIFKLAIECAIAPTMLNYNPWHCLPTAEDVPDIDIKNGA